MPNIPQGGMGFVGGPLDGVAVAEGGQSGQVTGPAPPGQMGAPPGLGNGGGLPAELQALLGQEQPAGEVDWQSIPEAKHFATLLDGVRQLNAKLDSEQNRLKLEKVTTLLQEIRAADEAEQEQAMQGRASPRLMRRAYGASQPT
jgi:hypothetical protein